jgi:hypothetical protein
MSNLAIFKDQNAVSNIRRPVSDLTKSVATSVAVNRIQTNTNGTFKRFVKGEQVGRAIRGEFNAIIVSMLPKVSRTFYAGKYDPDAKPTLPDCWSNNGDVPEAKATNRQAANCANCPKNIDGSGENGKGKACRFQRRVALLLEGDVTGDTYQFNIPAKSLFGKGNGITHPFESYVRFLAANDESVDYVVTNIAYNLDADTMELQFTPVRPITDAEYELVLAAQADPATQRLVQLTVAEADGATAKPAKPKQQVIEQEEEEEEEEEAPPAKPAKRAEKIEKAATPAWLDDGDDEEEEEEAPKVTAKRAPKKVETVKATNDLAGVLDAWADEDDD